jgi:transcriptional regulator with XRE-family HTH domain
LTQAQFGKLAGISRQYVGKIERGQKLSAELIAKICKETGVTADYIIFGIINPNFKVSLLCDLSLEQVDIGLDIIKRLAKLINTDYGNEILIKELMKRQRQVIKE